MQAHHNNPFLEKEIDFREHINVLCRRRWLIIAFTVILGTVSLIRAFMMTPVYEAKTCILIEREDPRILDMKNVAPTEYREGEYYQTQYKILKSRSLAEKVNKVLNVYVPWDKWKGRKQDKADVVIADEDRARSVLGRISIDPIPNTQLVEIRAEDIDPVLAAKIANLWAKQYILYVLGAKFEASQYASSWLQEKIVEAKNKLGKSEYKLQQYRKQHNLLLDEDEDDVRMTDQLLAKKADLEIELSEKREYFKYKHPEIIGLKSEIASVGEKIKAEREYQLQAGEQSIDYNMLKREVMTNREIYKALLERVGETEVMGELRATNIRIIDSATVPKRPIRPRKKLILLISLFIGLIGGSALSFLFESFDQSIKTPEDIKNRIGLPALASIAVPFDNQDKTVNSDFISHERPKSTIAESYRSLRTSIMFTSVERKRKTILLTSSGPQEGKTTVAINLAIVMAQHGEKTLLVDADLRRPRIEKAFNVSIEHGLTDVLSEQEELDAVIHKTDTPRLDVLACGSIPPNPSELLGSKKMDKLLDGLGKKYDKIIIDTPPVLAVTDAVVLVGKVDAALVVVKAGETNRNAAIKTKEMLQSTGVSSLIGAVLNMVDVDKSGGHYYYYQYYGKHGAKYGDDKETA